MPLKWSPSNLYSLLFFCFSFASLWLQISLFRNHSFLLPYCVEILSAPVAFSSRLARLLQPAVTIDVSTPTSWILISWHLKEASICICRYFLLCSFNFSFLFVSLFLRILLRYSLSFFFKLLLLIVFLVAFQLWLMKLFELLRPFPQFFDCFLGKLLAAIFSAARYLRSWRGSPRRSSFSPNQTFFWVSLFPK